MKYVWLIILICLISVVSGCASTGDKMSGGVARSGSYFSEHQK